MNFWNVLKYILMAFFAIILVVAFINSDDGNISQPTQMNQSGQSKFNF